MSLLNKSSKILIVHGPVKSFTFQSFIAPVSSSLLVRKKLARFAGPAWCKEALVNARCLLKRNALLSPFPRSLWRLVRSAMHQLAQRQNRKRISRFLVVTSKSKFLPNASSFPFYRDLFVLRIWGKQIPNSYTEFGCVYSLRAHTKKEQTFL